MTSWSIDRMQPQSERIIETIKEIQYILSIFFVRFYSFRANVSIDLCL